MSGTFFKYLYLIIGIVLGFIFGLCFEVEEDDNFYDDDEEKKEEEKKHYH